MTQCFLGDVLIVEHAIAFDRGGQRLTTDATGGGEDVADAAIEALDHAVGLRVPGPNQAVFDTQPHPFSIEDMVAGGCLALAGETIGELAAIPRRGSSIVGQELHHLHGGCGVQAAQEVGAADLALISVDPQIYINPLLGTQRVARSMATNR